MDSTASYSVGSDASAHEDRVTVVARPPRSGHARLAFIDFMRAIAVLLVFVRHSTEVFVPLGHGGRFIFLVGEYFTFGKLGVIVFFAISGFLIPSSLHGPKLAGSIRYVLSRVFRLYPAFAVSVIPSAASIFWLNRRPFSWHQVWLNFAMVPRLFGGSMANGGYWTLEVEITFYLVCLVLFLGGLLREAFCLAAITLMTFLLFQSSQQVIFGGLLNPALSADAFYFNINVAIMFWGAVLRLWWDGTRLNVATAVIFWGFSAFWILWRPACLLMAYISHHMDTIDPKIISAYSLGMALFLAAVLHGGLRNPIMLWIGRISYSLYLLSAVAIYVVNYELSVHASWRSCNAGIVCLGVLLLSLGLAQLSYSLVERPGIALGRRLTGEAFKWLERSTSSETSLLSPLAVLMRPLCRRPQSGGTKT